MFTNIKNAFDAALGTVYVRLESHRLRLLHLKTGTEIDQEPLVAIAPGPPERILEVGTDARALLSSATDRIELRNGFDHPRTLIGNFVLAEKTLQHFFKCMCGNALLRPSPMVIMHPLEHLEGGLTDIEIRAFSELAMGAGARKVFVWQGHELTLAELYAQAYKNEAER